ncbi:MAG TPA: lysylphosphatidylglycerol synthase transmembrane domain-containing protein [Verrucomicrobiae bacterium]|nr:lysylphosphatidylglycerol synthase transmembrane domain-containing protein [Verrucomicrobiae bacterium]
MGNSPMQALRLRVWRLGNCGLSLCIMGKFSREKHMPWIRIGCAALALAALVYVFSQINLHELAKALRSARVGWLIATIAVYWFVLLPSAWRWHLALELTSCAVRFGTTLRMTLIGHLFYTLFFGVAGGDVAKSALYARRNRLPLPEVLAAAPLDRLLGFGGLVIFIIASFALAAANGAFSQFRPASLKLPASWTALAVVLAAIFFIAWFVRRRSGHETAFGRLVLTFLKGWRRLVKSPRILWQGLLCGLAVQLALAASLAFGLEAVSNSPVPWGRLIWTLPVISVASALPVNIAGMGLREGAVLALLGLYGVSPADAVAASLLTLLARLFWAGVGAAALWQRQPTEIVGKPVPG